MEIPKQPSTFMECEELFHEVPWVSMARSLEILATTIACPEPSLLHGEKHTQEVLRLFYTQYSTEIVTALPSWFETQEIDLSPEISFFLLRRVAAGNLLAQSMIWSGMVSLVASPRSDLRSMITEAVTDWHDSHGWLIYYAVEKSGILYSQS